jgi:hypothetical protein
VEDILLKLQEEMEVAWGMLHGLDYSDFRVNALRPMRAAADHISAENATVCSAYKVPTTMAL